ncbi:MAG: hypothetical protein M5U12_37535 [Verrucomicrobia bacterium]|nr:hypothetical protein [Verrucomicrobiota bacterium]
MTSEQVQEEPDASPDASARRLVPGPLRLFPAVPAHWTHASFDDLRAEGGHRVSARLEDGTTTWLRVVAGQDGLVRIRDNFGGRPPRWNRPDLQKFGRDYAVWLLKDQVLEATF